MRKIIKEYEVYKFEELDKATQEKVVSSMIDINTDHNWWNGDYHLGFNEQEWISVLGEAEYKKQSDACTLPQVFKYDDISFDLDRGRFLQFRNLEVVDTEVFRRFLKLPTYIFQRISYSFEAPRYGCFDTNTRLVLEWSDRSQDTYPKVETMLQDAEKIFSERVREALCDLQRSYDYLCSEEAIVETIQANEYEFTSNGKIFN